MFQLLRLFGILQNDLIDIRKSEMFREWFFNAHKGSLYKGTGYATVMDERGNIIQLIRIVFATKPPTRMYSVANGRNLINPNGIHLPGMASCAAIPGTLILCYYT